MIPPRCNCDSIFSHRACVVHGVVGKDYYTQASQKEATLLKRIQALSLELTALKPVWSDEPSKTGPYWWKLEETDKPIFRVVDGFDLRNRAKWPGMWYLIPMPEGE